MPGLKQVGLQIAHCGSGLRPSRRVVRVLRVTAAGSLSLLPAFRPMVLHPVRDGRSGETGFVSVRDELQHGSVETSDEPDAPYIESGQLNVVGQVRRRTSGAGGRSRPSD